MRFSSSEAHELLADSSFTFRKPSSTANLMGITAEVVDEPVPTPAEVEEVATVVFRGANVLVQVVVTLHRR